MSGYRDLMRHQTRSRDVRLRRQTEQEPTVQETVRTLTAGLADEETEVTGSPVEEVLLVFRHPM
jgi:hypothetical protein